MGGMMRITRDFESDKFGKIDVCGKLSWVTWIFCMYEGRDHPTSKYVQCVYYSQVSLGILEGEQWATFVELPKVAYFQCCILPFCLFDYPHHHWELLVFILFLGFCFHLCVWIWVWVFGSTLFYQRKLVKAHE